MEAMNARHRSRWAYAWILAAWTLGGCSDDDPAVIGPRCFPECRAGTLCSPSGTCVSPCNPACGASETCVGSGASARCVPPGADSGVATDLGPSGGDATGGDVGAASDAGATDLGVATDVPPGTDLGISDTGAGPGDGGAPTDAFTPPMNCGMPGQVCCVTRGCYGGGYCEAGTCRAPSMRDPGECNRAEDCPAGQSCGGPFVCGGGPDAGVNDAGAIVTRRCFRCEAPPGAGAFGATCGNGGECQTGVCSNSRCTVACPVGEAGDALCQARGANQRCINVFYQPVSMGPLTTLGVCAPTCARDGDCAAGTACVPRLNYFADRMDFACAPAPASAVTAVGGACNPNGASTCRNVLCVGTSATAGYCTAPCNINSDCPAAAPICDGITLSRPSNMGQAARACRPCRLPSPAACD
jgi:hypothetical protein